MTSTATLSYYLNRAIQPSSNSGTKLTKQELLDAVAAATQGKKLDAIGKEWLDGYWKDGYFDRSVVAPKGLEHYATTAAKKAYAKL